MQSERCNDEHRCPPGYRPEIVVIPVQIQHGEPVGNIALLGRQFPECKGWQWGPYQGGIREYYTNAITQDGPLLQEDLVAAALRELRTEAMPPGVHDALTPEHIVALDPSFSHLGNRPKPGSAFPLGKCYHYALAFLESEEVGLLRPARAPEWRARREPVAHRWIPETVLEDALPERCMQKAMHMRRAYEQGSAALLAEAYTQSF